MTPDLQYFHDNEKVHGINFWCCNHSCLTMEMEDTGTLAIDFGPGTTLPDLAEISHCRVCGGKVQVSPSWGEGGQSWFGSLSGSAAGGR